MHCVYFELWFNGDLILIYFAYILTRMLDKGPRPYSYVVWVGGFLRQLLDVISWQFDYLHPNRPKFKYLIFAVPVLYRRDIEFGLMYENSHGACNIYNVALGLSKFSAAVL